MPSFSLKLNSMPASLKSEGDFSATMPLLPSDVVFKSHGRARRYIARVDSQGRIAITVPRGGSQGAALAFANEHRDWLYGERERWRRERCRAGGRRLKFGDAILLRGEPCELRLEKDRGRPFLRVGSLRIALADESMDLARPLKAFLKRGARSELSSLVFELADRHGLKGPKRVSVRDQRTRWGSLSTSGTMSLSWRLVLVSPAARDYVILHELAHLLRFDHSPEFWRIVEGLCPDYRRQESWLGKHQEALSW